ncbi:MAG TPA: RNA-binding S4 domain-containing protein [Geminicoccaceae bacterium]
MSEDAAALRLDKWLFFARFFKTRALAAEMVARGRLRINNVVIKKAHYRVRAGDVLTFPQAGEIRVVRVLMVGDRRGPASKARMLYESLEV